MVRQNKIYMHNYLALRGRNFDNVDEPWEHYPGLKEQRLWSYLHEVLFVSKLCITVTNAWEKRFILAHTFGGSVCDPLSRWLASTCGDTSRKEHSRLGQKEKRERGQDPTIPFEGKPPMTEDCPQPLHHPGD
jgi:hypothetical protein